MFILERIIIKNKCLFRFVCISMERLKWNQAENFINKHCANISQPLVKYNEIIQRKNYSIRPSYKFNKNTQNKQSNFSYLPIFFILMYIINLKVNITRIVLLYKMKNAHFSEKIKLLSLLNFKLNWTFKIFKQIWIILTMIFSDRYHKIRKAININSICIKLCFLAYTN